MIIEDVFICSQRKLAIKGAVLYLFLHEMCHNKTCLLDFGQGLTQTGCTVKVDG